MEDIIGQGEERPPGNSRRRLLIALALVVVAVLVVVEHLPSGHHAGHRQAASVRQHPRQATGPDKVRFDGPGATRPTGIVGPTAQWAAATRVPRTGHHPDWFWPGRHRAEPIQGLPYDRSGYVFTRVPGGWAVTGEDGGSPSCGDCPGSPPPVFYLASRAGSVTRIGAATMVASGAGKVGGQATMWLTTFPGTMPLGTIAGTTREYSATGQALGAPVTLPVGYAVAQGTPRGLLLISITQLSAAGTYQLWNPAGGRLVRTFSGVIAASATEVALRAGCGVSCPVQVVNLTTGRQGSIKVPAGSSVTGGVFSPDGRYLALQVSFGDGSDGGALGAQLEVASMATYRLTAVPHTSVSSDALTGFGWPVAGDGLVAEFSFSTRSQMAIWHPATASLAVASVRPDENPVALVVG